MQRYPSDCGEDRDGILQSWYGTMNLASQEIPTRVN